MFTLNIDFGNRTEMSSLDLRIALRKKYFFFNLKWNILYLSKKISIATPKFKIGIICLYFHYKHKLTDFADYFSKTFRIHYYIPCIIYVLKHSYFTARATIYGYSFFLRSSAAYVSRIWNDHSSAHLIRCQVWSLRFYTWWKTQSSIRHLIRFTVRRKLCPTKIRDFPLLFLF